MAEEEENKVISQPNNSDDNNASLNPLNNQNTIEEVINLGVYGLTGVEDAVSKPNDELLPDEKTQSPNTQINNTQDDDTKLQDSNHNEDNAHIADQATDSNSEGIAANAGEDENDDDNQDQGQLEELTNKLGELLQNEKQQDDNEEGEEEGEEEEEEEEAEDPMETIPPQEAPEIKKEDDDNNKKADLEQPIQEILTAATDVLLQPDPEVNKDSDKSEKNDLTNVSTDAAASLLPNNENNDENKNQNNDDNEINDNLSNENETTQENNNENNDDKDTENTNENNEGNDENQEATQENNDDNEEGTDGMSVHDEFKDSYTDWGKPDSPKIPGTRSISHLPPLETTPELDSQSKRFLERFEQHGKLPDPEFYSQVLQYIQREKVNSVVSNDFISAGHYQNISQRFITAINSTHQNENHKKKIDHLEEKLEETNNQLRSFQHETDELIKQERYRLTDKRAQLVNIHEETLNKFEDRWNDEVFLVKYAKPSSDLLQAKKVERSFILVKDFEGAENCRKKIAELEKLESQEAQKRARSEMEKQYKKLTSKQEAEIESFDEMAKTQLALVSKDRSEQLEKLVARQSKLQSQIYDLKNPGRQSWTSASGPISLKAGSKGTSLGTSLPSLDKKASSKLENLMTPRTIQRYALFKTTVKQPKLTVKPLGSINQKRKQVQAPKF